MFEIIIAAIIYITLSVAIKLDENEKNRRWKESNEIDWNAYYAN